MIRPDHLHVRSGTVLRGGDRRRGSPARTLCRRVLEEDGQEEGHCQAEDADQGLGGCVDLGGLAHVHAEGLFDQPEAGVVDVVEADRARSDGDDDQRQVPAVDRRGQRRDDAGGGADPDRRRSREADNSSASSQPSRTTLMCAPPAAEAMAWLMPVSSSTWLNAPPPPMISRMPTTALRLSVTDCRTASPDLPCASPNANSATMKPMSIAMTGSPTRRGRVAEPVAVGQGDFGDGAQQHQCYGDEDAGGRSPRRVTSLSPRISVAARPAFLTRPSPGRLPEPASS